METSPETEFDLLLSIDLAEDAELNVPPSVSLRFWAVRDGFHCVTPTKENLEQFAQPVLIETINHKIEE